MGTKIEFDVDAEVNPASARILEARANLAKPRKAKPKKKATAPKERFTTDYCKKWGKRQGWKLRDYEYTDQLGHSHDIGPGADAKFETDVDFVYVQGAGRYQKAEHYQRFIERGGVATCRKQNARFVYVEFVKGSAEPVLTEWWA